MPVNGRRGAGSSSDFKKTSPREPDLLPGAPFSSILSETKILGLSNASKFPACPRHEGRGRPAVFSKLGGNEPVPSVYRRIRSMLPEACCASLDRTSNSSAALGTTRGERVSCCAPRKADSGSPSRWDRTSPAAIWIFASPPPTSRILTRHPHGGNMHENRYADCRYSQVQTHCRINLGPN
jgi:hypothetical protein